MGKRENCHTDGERQFIASLVETVAPTGVTADPLAIVNFYVALKSKPLAILAGPAHSGKMTFVRCLTRALTGGDPARCQTMVGHAWWAERSRNVALFTEAQTRLNAEIILALMETALRPERSGRVFTACLGKISPAEVLGFFSDVAFQLQSDRLMRLPSAHLAEPLPFPPNLFVIGTMDTERLDWMDEDLLAKTNVIQWPLVPGRRPEPKSLTPEAPFGEKEFLRSCIRREGAASQKLRHILGMEAQAYPPFRQLISVLEAHMGAWLEAVVGESLIYLANAWSRRCIGLFDLAPARNLAIAFDLAVAQTFLPRHQAAIRRSNSLHGQLRAILDGKFPHSAAWLNTLT